MTPDQIAELAEACGIQRRAGQTDEQLFAACIRMIRANMGTPA